MYTILFTEAAKRDVLAHQASGNLSLLRKINALLGELREHPRTGTGKPERLRGDLSGLWSRRINREHRLVYSIHDAVVTVEVISARSHYGG